MTLGQTMILYENLVEHENDTLKFYAAIHGIDLNKETEEEDFEKTEPEKQSGTEKPQFFFRDPDEYKHLTDEQKQELTKKAMGHWKNWAGQRPSLGGKDR